MVRLVDVSQFSLVIARLSAAAVVLAVLLTGCGADDSPEPSGKAGADQSPSAQPSAQAPVNAAKLPAYAKNPGREGAEQFVGYWVNALNRATESGEIEQLAAASATTCRMCASYAQGIDEIYDASGHVESGGWDIREITHEGGGSDAQRAMIVSVQVAPQKVYRSESAKPEKFKGGEVRYRMVVSRVDDSHWLVQDLAPAR